MVLAAGPQMIFVSIETRCGSIYLLDYPSEVITDKTLNQNSLRWQSVIRIVVDQNRFSITRSRQFPEEWRSHLSPDYSDFRLLILVLMRDVLLQIIFPRQGF